MPSKFRHFWMCKLNPDYQTHLPWQPAYERIIDEEEIIDEGIVDEEMIDEVYQDESKRRPWRTTAGISVAIIVFTVGVFLLAIPSTVQLYLEGIYPFEDAVATYNFEIIDPAALAEKMYLNIRTESSRPAIMSHVPLNVSVVLIPSDNKLNDSSQHLYYVIFSGSQCTGYGKNFQLQDGTCKMILLKKADGQYRNSFESIKYLASGDFPVLLSTDSSAKVNVTRTEHHIVISPMETYLANEYARYALYVAIYAAVFVVGIEIYKLSKISTRSNP